MTQLLAIPLLWLGYAALHSALASRGLKSKVAARWPRAAGLYRLVYNLVAVALLLPILHFVSSIPGESLWAWRGPWRWVAMGVLTFSVLGGVLSSMAYDMRAFLGLQGETHSQFRVTGIHRIVRHPWYFFALCFLWTRDMNAAHLVQAGSITLYLIIGSRMEDRRLVASIGRAYELYRSMVPGLLPWPGRFVGSDELERIANADAESTKLDIRSGSPVDTIAEELGALAPDS